jgi:hypothetical protein
MIGEQTEKVVQLHFENVEQITLQLFEFKDDPLFLQVKTFLAAGHKIPNSTMIFFLKLCILYFTGGAVLNANIHLKRPLNALEGDLCVIQSCLNADLFSGFIAGKKGSPVIWQIMEEWMQLVASPSPDAETSITKRTLCLAGSNNCLILREQIVGDISNIYFNEEILLEHYFKNTLYLERCHIPLPVEKTRIRIGISVNIPDTLKDFYSNGIQQNCLYLYELLTNIGYDVWLIIADGKNKSVLEGIEFYQFKYIVLPTIFEYDLNLIISMGVSFPKILNECLKNTGMKLVYYMCGNNYLIDSEVILYSQHKTRNISYTNDRIYDEIWCIPQMYKQNKYYCEVVHKTKCIQAPFIWSPMSIQFVTKILNLPDEKPLYYKKKESKIGIFEPNMSVMKWALPCLMIAENTHRTYNNVRHVYVTNINKSNSDNKTNQFNMPQFNNVVHCLDLFAEKKISVESRFITLDFMRQFCDIAVSHQWENNLNYLYFDLAWMGWPILHNANLCQDIGYYYEEFNYHQGGEMLNHIIVNHDANASAYLERNRRAIEPFLPSNIHLQNKYRQLVEKLF